MLKGAPTTPAGVKAPRQDITKAPPRLHPENFLNMIDDLHTDVDDVKFVDDVTLYEVCNTHSQNKLQNAVDDIQEWATDNNMSLNTKQNQRTSGLLWKRGLGHPSYHHQW